MVWRINERRLNRTIEEVKFLEGYFSEGDSILDVGCGTGRHIIEFCRKGYHIMGVDLSKEMLSVAENNLLGEHFESELARADASCLPFTESCFDHAISMFNVFLELLSRNERLEAPRQMKRAANGNGCIVIGLRVIGPFRKPSDQTHEIISLEDRDFWELIVDEKEKTPTEFS